VTTLIAHVSDIHVGGKLREATAAAPQAIEAFDPTLVAVTGDLTLNGWPREFRAS
jgi:3',5'-cyclic AMP phosphodiesterase CpdA